MDLPENSTQIWYVNKLNFDCFYRFYNTEILKCIKIFFFENDIIFTGLQFDLLIQTTSEDILPGYLSDDLGGKSSTLDIKMTLHSLLTPSGEMQMTFYPLLALTNLTQILWWFVQNIPCPLLSQNKFLVYRYLVLPIIA